MPLYMDTHKKVEGLTPEAVAGAHKADLEVQGKHGVAPNKEAAIAVHREAHGLVADDVIEVKEGS